MPIIKKEEGEEVEDYRGITLMPSLHKIYMTILAERLREDVESKGLITGNQTGFRKEMGMMDQIYTLNYLVNRQLGKEKGGMTVLFVDLKAVFDSVHRDRLIEAMKMRGVREGLINKIEEIMKETKSRVRVEEQWSEKFWLTRRVRQDCSISPMLFNLMITDMEEYTAKRI